MDSSIPKHAARSTRFIASLGAALCVVFSAQAAVAGESGQVTITRMALASNLGELVHIKLSGMTSKGSCSNNSTWDYVLDTSNAWGKATYAMLLEARAAGRQVWISGTNLCPTNPLLNIEYVRSVTTYE
ncbi:hypothetical protein [Steroidobacter cummioxidans]|uniref:hypothetical protein n=1 Tax=Steroidobacter cummioxidans TaxID=1803913 RepID=UPI00129002B7|nr:hypothetical protein [Steroidobacter cummioxidans]